MLHQHAFTFSPTFTLLVEVLQTHFIHYVGVVVRIHSAQRRFVSQKVNTNLLLTRFRELTFTVRSGLPIRGYTYSAELKPHTTRLTALRPKHTFHEPSLNHIPNHARLGLPDHKSCIGRWDAGTGSQSARFRT